MLVWLAMFRGQFFPPKFSPMKYSICLLTAMIIFTACDKKTDVEPVLAEDYWGGASAEKDGEAWIAYPACWINLIDKKNIVIEIDSFAKGQRLYYLKESLVIDKIPPMSGTYQVEKSFVDTAGTNAHFSYWNYDELLGIYNILESDSATNRVTLASYDTLTKEIKGSFNLTFLAQTRSFPEAPDTVRFKNGTFHGKVVKK